MNVLIFYFFGFLAICILHESVLLSGVSSKKNIFDNDLFTIQLKKNRDVQQSNTFRRSHCSNIFFFYKQKYTLKAHNHGSLDKNMTRKIKFEESGKTNYSL